MQRNHSVSGSGDIRLQDTTGAQGVTRDQDGYLVLALAGFGASVTSEFAVQTSSVTRERIDGQTREHNTRDPLPKRKTEVASKQTVW
jgi:hypothetical protein